MAEDARIEEYYTNDLDEVAYLICRGARLIDKEKSSPTSNWYVYHLEGVVPEWRKDMGDESDKSVSVARFIHQRQQLKFQLSQTRRKAPR